MGSGSLKHVFTRLLSGDSILASYFLTACGLKQPFDVPHLNDYCGDDDIAEDQDEAQGYERRRWHRP